MEGRTDPCSDLQDTEAATAGHMTICPRSLCYELFTVFSTTRVTSHVARQLIRHLSIANIAANNFRKSKDFLQSLRRHYAMSLRHNFLSAIMQNENVAQGNFMQKPY